MLQPLEKAFFVSLKAVYAKEALQFMVDNLRNISLSDTYYWYMSVNLFQSSHLFTFY
jgi:hypothetical protein